jgi:hypothetical protein
MLYPGCTKFSRFSFVVKLLHMKALYRIRNYAFTVINWLMHFKDTIQSQNPIVKQRVC